MPVRLHMFPRNAQVIVSPCVHHERFGSAWALGVEVLSIDNIHVDVLLFADGVSVLERLTELRKLVRVFAPLHRVAADL